MAFVSPSLVLIVFPRFRQRLMLATKTCPCQHRTRMALSGPERASQSDSSHPSNSSYARPEEPAEYNQWSSHFLQLCSAQLQLLQSTTPNLLQITLFFRRENPETGALEFVPLIVLSSESDHNMRVWISDGAAAHTELEEAQSSRVLPGGIPAQWLLPDYPFTFVDKEGGILMPDGGLCVPVEYNGVLAGSIVLTPDFANFTERPDPNQVWSSDTVKRASIVAQSIALGAALEGKWHMNEQVVNVTRTMIASLRAIMSKTLHQVRSPITALVTFGHLLLRKLPPGHSSRDLAKSLILEALRIDELLKPLDEARADLRLPEASGETPWFPGTMIRPAASQLPSLAANTGDYSASQQVPPLEWNELPPSGVGTIRGVEELVGSGQGGKQLIWLADVLTPEAERYHILVTERGMNFSSDIDDDSPPVIAVEKYVREAVSNLLDNAIKYCRKGSFIGLKCYNESIDNFPNSETDVVRLVVWDTGLGFVEGEVEKVWEFGTRGSASERLDVPGTGLGLSIVRELLDSCDAEIELFSPLPARLDPRRNISEVERMKNPGSAFVVTFQRAAI